MPSSEMLVREPPVSKPLAKKPLIRKMLVGIPLVSKGLLHGNLTKVAAAPPSPVTSFFFISSPDSSLSALGTNL